VIYEFSALKFSSGQKSAVIEYYGSGCGCFTLPHTIKAMYIE
jgi:hypothetical protein